MVSGILSIKAIWDWNLTTNKVYYSARWKLMLGYADQEIGDNPDEWFSGVHPEDLELLKSALAAHVEGQKPHFECEHRLMSNSGSYRWMLSRGVAVLSESGEPVRMAGSQSDITERTVYDPLTSLPNRILFSEQMLRSLGRKQRRSAYNYAVLTINLDNFKIVNDSLGTVGTNQLLVAVARHLQEALRFGDTVARLEADEFVVLLDDLRSTADVDSVVVHILESIRTPLALGGKRLFPAPTSA